MRNILSRIRSNLGTIVVNTKAKFFQGNGRKKVVTRENILKATIGVSIIASLVGCGANQASSSAVPENPEATNTQGADDADTGELTGDDDSFTFEMPADILNGKLGTVSIKNTMKTPEQVIAELNEKYGDTYTGPTYTPEKGGDTWASEQDYQEAKDAGLLDAAAGTEKVTITGDAYIAPDGSAWTSEAEYKKYVEGQKGDTVVTTDSGWVAPDGSVWTSEEEYNKYVQSQNGTVVTPGSGEVVERGEGYLAPDGTYWESQEEWLKYISGVNQTTEYYDDTYQDDYYQDDYEDYSPSTEQRETDEYGGYYQDGYYWVNGEVYASKQDYLDLLYGGQQNEVGDDTPQYEASSDFYTAPDGSVWTSEEEYRMYEDSLTAENGYAK